MSNVVTNVVGFREKMIQLGLEAEMRGMRLTRKAPACFSIIAKEYGIVVKRSANGKRAAYEAFCQKIGAEPKPADPVTP